MAGGQVPAEVVHDTAALGAGQLVDVKLAVQVIGLVLQAACQLAGPGDGDRTLLQVEALGDGVPRAGPVRVDARDGQAPLRARVAAGGPDDPRIDQVAKLVIDVLMAKIATIAGKAREKRDQDGIW